MTATQLRTKVLEMSRLSSVLGGLGERGDRIVLAHGCFDVLHPGHIGYLRAAKAMGDVLVVSVTADEYVNKGPGKPMFPLAQRMEQVAALETVDYVTPSHASTAVELIHCLTPDVFVKGGDYSESTILSAEKEAVERGNGKVAFTPYYPVPKAGLTETFHAYSEETWRWLEGFRRRHGSDEILTALDSIRDMNVLVVGEAITDKYIFVNTLTKSPREHHLSVKYLREESYAGGATAIANHLIGLVDSVRLVTQEEPVVKTRFVEVHEQRKLFSVQHFPERMTVTLDYGSIPDYDLVICMDYGHGLFTPQRRDAYEIWSRFLAVNCQTNSANYGFNLISRWKRSDFACMDGPEYNLAIANGFDPHTPRNLIVTNGAKGCNFGMDVPSFVTRLVDRVGAGDALFALAAPLVAKDVDREVAAFVGSCAAAMQCETVGNEKPIDPKALRKFIERLTG